ncbi:MAG: UDP-N-acetylmuramate--L-alanine ligase [Rubrivivax sp.]|nr:UDP-N-acetylmuramate--L-alanine ligase [Rubrivivax sp.]
MKHAVKHLHFVGVGGSGMSPLAEIFQRLGYRVSGSDLAASAVTERLAALGVTVFIGHDAAHVAGAQAVVTSTAVQPDNPEVVAARAARVPVVPRAVLLAELMRRKDGIAIAGTHGKTTTTSLVASVLAEAGADPTFVIGGELKALGANAKLGQGELIVVEADESDASFLVLSPVVAVVTNIDADHMETYGHDLARLHGAFVDFLHRLPFYGRAVLCSDDAGVRAVLPRVQRPLTTYGLGEGADLRALDVQALPEGRMRFVARQAGWPDLPVELALAGEHNVRNALAAIAVARELALPDSAAQRALAAFQGVGRRFQRWGETATADGGRATVVDDYGHHPVELAAVLAAARGAFPGRRLVLVFQPHRYTRTRDCLADFAAVIARFDAALLTEVYAAGEAPIDGADGRALARAVQQAGRADAQFVGALADLPQAVAAAARGGDVLLVMGAGSIAALPRALVQAAVQATAEVRA